ncbi:MAG: M15 family metallopeptidase [Clostridiales Family XIII bacterium]|jgi:D-alanyl-D-alanine carboxypeptidase|nr:M15 family metallopeptidase [Clostridiales Family XIII bacterium]
MRKEAAQQFYKLVEAAAGEGYELVMTTAYRSYDFQQILWNNYVANEGEAAASRFSARPGQSEHQSGLAVDVSSPSVDYSLTETFGKTEEGIWLAQNAHRFGFIIRFPEEKESITGYLYEPWHIRYVGEPVATEIYAKDLTLEEYLELYGLI